MQFAGRQGLHLSLNGLSTFERMVSEPGRPGRTRNGRCPGTLEDRLSWMIGMRNTSSIRVNQAGFAGFSSKNLEFAVFTPQSRRFFPDCGISTASEIGTAVHSKQECQNLAQNRRFNSQLNSRDPFSWSRITEIPRYSTVFKISCQRLVRNS